MKTHIKALIGVVAVGLIALATIACTDNESKCTANNDGVTCDNAGCECDSNNVSSCICNGNAEGGENSSRCSCQQKTG